MAGGSGKRFWPMSRSKHPKQLLALSGEETLITMAVKRVEGFIPKENVLVFTNVEQLDKVYDQLKPAGVRRENFYGEPLRRDTAACVGYAAAVVRKLDKDGVMMVLPSDHMISPVEKYHEALGRAIQAAKKGYLVTIGVKPKHPATGYGYIQKNNPLKTAENAFTVKAFKEKPDVETAQKFLESGDYYWNCGIFVWKASEILKSIESLMPKLHKNVEKIAEALGAENAAEAIAAEFGKIEPISIDYGVMEKAKNVAVVEADFAWDDVGSWTALDRHFPHNDAGNVFRGTAYAIESANCTALCEGNHLVTLIGCRDLIVVHTPDATLVVPKVSAEKVKDLVDRLAEEGRTDVL
jgi:mannose-1-phosphate guanylyltransferase